MSVKIELGFTADGVGAPFFVIGDPARGVIGNTEFVLGGGELFVDVTESLQSFSITRGKSRELDRFNAGQLSASFTNNNRWFDPTYPSSPYFGQIVPKRSVRVSVDNVYQYLGVTDDWNIAYDAAGNSVASLSATDSFAILAGNAFSDFAPDEELSGARINAALDNVSWSPTQRQIDTGDELLEGQIIADGTSALDYLTVVERSEVGFLFINKTGDVRFISRNSSFTPAPLTFSDAGTGIPYESISVVYGSELLYNQIVTTSSAGTATAGDALSQALYGLNEYDLATYLATETQLEKIANGLLAIYKDPEFRFEKITINLNTISPSQRAELLALELGDVVFVEFTPSDIPPQVKRTGRIISIAQDHQPAISTMTIGLSAIDGSPIVIGSSIFGIIGEGVIGF
jgi:hypothetical protein